MNKSRFSITSTISMLALIALPAVTTALPAFAQGSLSIGLQDDPDTLDPATNWSFVGRHVLQQLCDKIVDIDTEGKIIPMLAESWEWNAESTQLTLKIRKDAIFHDGTPVNAEAIKYNLDRALTMEGSRRKSEISAIEKTEAVDEFTLRIDLKTPSVPLLAALSDRAGMIISPKAGAELGAKFTTAPVCSGPYSFVEYTPQDHLTLKKFDGYYNADKYSFNELVFRGIPDSSVRLLNLKSGQMDLIERLAPTEVAALKADPAYTVSPVVGLGYYGVTFNVADEGPMGKSAALREAFSLAVDREAINNAVFEGQFAPGNQPFPVGSPWYDASVPVPARDVEAAKAKLAEAGIADPKVELLVPTDAERQQVAQILQAMVAEAGITMEIKPTELMTLLDLAKEGKFQAHLVGWSGRVDPDLNITPMLSCNAAGNDAHYCNPELDQKLAAARAVTDPATRAAGYAEVNKILQRDLPISYLYHAQWIFALNGKLAGFTPRPDGIIRLDGVTRAE